MCVSGISDVCVIDVSDMPSPCAPTTLPSTPAPYPATCKVFLVSHDFHACEEKSIKNICKAENSQNIKLKTGLKPTSHQLQVLLCLVGGADWSISSRDVDT